MDLPLIVVNILLFIVDNGLETDLPLIAVNVLVCIADSGLEEGLLLINDVDPFHRSERRSPSYNNQSQRTA